MIKYIEQLKLAMNLEFKKIYSEETLSVVITNYKYFEINVYELPLSIKSKEVRGVNQSEFYQLVYDETTGVTTPPSISGNEFYNTLYELVSNKKEFELWLQETLIEVL